ncbi:MAG: tetratricopeptide repeat protein [Bryobacteraceae bacterium]
MRGVMLSMLALAAAGCGGETPGPIPVIDVTGLASAARGAIGNAYAAARAAPRDGRASGRLGMHLLAYRYDDPALACFERARILQPAAADWHHYAGTIFLKRKQYPLAAARFRRVLELDPKSTAARVLLAETALGQRGFLQARDAFAAVLESQPKTPRAVFGLGVSLVALGRPAEAIPYFERALALVPGYSQARFALAEVHRKAGHPGKAAALMEGYNVSRVASRRAVQAPLDDPRMDAVQALNVGPRQRRVRAAALAASGRLPDAIRLMEQGLREDPDQVVFRADLALFRAMSGDLAAASGTSARAAAIDPDAPPVLIAKGGNRLAARPARRCRGGVRTGRRAIDVGIPALLRAAGEWIALGRPAEAEQRLRTILDANPDVPPASLRLGLLLAESGRRAEALPHLERASKRKSEELPRVLYQLGLAYAEAGRQDEAQRNFRYARNEGEIRGQPGVARLAAARITP